MYKRFRGCLVVVTGLLILYMFTAFGGKSNESALPTVASLATMTSRPDVRSSPTVAARGGFVTITPAAGTVYPTATITDTPSSTVGKADATRAIEVTPMEIQVLFTVSTVNLRSCPNTSCPIVEKVLAGVGLGVTGTVVGEEVNAGNAVWYKVNHSAAEEYAYSRFMSTIAPAELKPINPVGVTNQVPVTAAPIQQNAVYPKNCSTAVAMGLSDVEAAKYPDLDRNHNGVACYGD